MGVLFKRRGGKQVLFITDEGVVYGTSVSYARMVLDDGANGGFVVLSRLVSGVPPGKFPLSPVWGSGVVKRDGMVMSGKEKDDKREYLDVDLGVE